MIVNDSGHTGCTVMPCYRTILIFKHYYTSVYLLFAARVFLVNVCFVVLSVFYNRRLFYEFYANMVWCGGKYFCSLNVRLIC